MMDVNYEIADPFIVREFSNNLVKAFEEFINKFDGNVDYIDGIMAVINLAKAVVENLEEQTDNNPIWRNAMVTSLEASLYDGKDRPYVLQRWAIILKNENLIDIYSVQHTKQNCVEKFELDFGYSWEEAENAGWRAIPIQITPRSEGAE